MEPDNHRKSSTLTDREKVKFKNELFIYLFFLLISIGFWYLIALGKEQRAVISFPVQYENWPTGKALVSDLPQELEISVRGVGYSILRHKLTAYFRPISLSVRNFVFDSIWHQNHFEYLTYTRDLRETLLNHMNNEVQVIDIMPDTLRFVFAKVVEKMVPIRSVLNLQYENQYQLYGRIVSDPESIVVSGPGLLVDTLKCVYTKSFEQKNIKDSIISEVELTPYKKISFQRNKVWLIIPVQKFTELELNIPIETENITDGIVVKTFPGYVTLTCKVAVSEYSKISPYMFRATIDYQSIMSSGQKKARVSLAKFPLNVENIKFYPRNVEYLIEK